MATAKTPGKIMESARDCLLADGYANLSTRKVADRAGVPLSQIHYHFGGKQGMVLALLDYENQRLVSRQRQMYAASAPLWKRYEQACDFLDDDLASGYVRVLQEMIAAGWSDSAVARQVLAMLQGWMDLLEEVAGEAEKRFGSLGPFTAAELAALIGISFLGGEAMILLGDESWAGRVHASLRRVAELIRVLEEGVTPPGPVEPPVAGPSAPA
ncbi:TetR/AcrR family transcriptional regulator [Catelliglobosispora koreensis]|uniref:TetR/AcrR family transcriptional regulator n=1 Tax=Catelliglobosispora koreensis TaxID=129052 RepID=UPI00037A0080|nr:TetR/AcrR family transcriptional regulator [Catelliglobosispora koreensis]